MEENLRISVVTPSFNQGRFLEATIKSVLGQNYPNLEYIVLDGGSTDDSVDILRKYDQRLSYWRSARDNGQADAINQGFNRSTGQILCWVNSDDILLPGSLDEVNRYFKTHAGVECVVGGSVILDQQGGMAVGNRLRIPIINPGMHVTFRSLLLLGCGFNQPASFWKRDPFFEVGGLDATLRFSFDYDFYLRLARRRKFGAIQAYLAGFRVYPGTMTHSFQNVRVEEDSIVLKRHGRSQFPFWSAALYRLIMGNKHFLHKMMMRALFHAGAFSIPYK